MLYIIAVITKQAKQREAEYALTALIRIFGHTQSPEQIPDAGLSAVNIRLRRLWLVTKPVLFRLSHLLIPVPLGVTDTTVDPPFCAACVSP